MANKKPDLTDRWKCPHCGTEGWGARTGKPQSDHDRPDGRACIKSRLVVNFDYANNETAYGLKVYYPIDVRVF